MMINIKVAAVINPSPPIVIIANITTCPNIDQYSAVETAVWPVTVAADVAVSMAIRNGVKLLSEQFVIPALQLLEIGSSNNTVPITMNPRNPIRIYICEPSHIEVRRISLALTIVGPLSVILG